MGGMHGEAYANRAIQGCDVLIAMGMRFDDRITGRLDSFAKQAKIIHFELDHAEVGKNVVPDVPVIGDLGETLPALLPLIEDRRHQVWIQELKEWKSDTAQADILNYEVEDELIPPFVIRQLWHATHNIANGPAIVVTDVGQHQMWECQYYIHDHAGQLLTSGGLGTMGYALPAAIGAQMAFPDRLVWAVAGDGGFQMTLQELAVLKQEHLPVKIAIINNGFLGMVRQWQQLFYDKRYTGTPVVSPDFVKLADAYDIPAVLVTRPDQVVAAYERAIATPGPFLIDFHVKEEVNVYPMVAPGAAVDQLIRRPKPSVVQGYSGVQPSW
jgi:acetolactate synthase-1/2/3 large subunit